MAENKIPQPETVNPSDNAAGTETSNDTDNTKSGKKRNRNRNNNPKNGKQEPPKIAPIVTGSKDNDPIWYGLNQRLVKDATQMNFNDPLGVAYDIQNVFGSLTAGQELERMPGIMVLEAMHVLGDTHDETDPVNRAATALYSYVRHANSGSRNYGVADLMMYTLATDSLYSIYSWACRILGIYKYYSALNMYTAQSLIMAMGVDFYDLRKHAADFRTGLNSLATSFGIFAVPKSIYYMTRHIWMYESIYTDSETAKGQFYLYNPAGYYIYNDPEIAKTGVMNWHPLDESINPNGNLNVYLKCDDIIDILNRIYAGLQASQDVGLISGDILKAFGGSSQMFQTYPIAENYVAPIVYSKEVLSQFENAYIYPGSKNSWSCQIGQNLDPEKGGNYIQQVIRKHTTGDYLIPTKQVTELVTTVEQRYLNFHKDDVTADDIMVATRLMAGGWQPAAYPVGDTDLRDLEPKNFGSEIIVSAYMIKEPATLLTRSLRREYFWSEYHNMVTGGKRTNPNDPISDINYSTVDVSTALTNASNIASALSAFDWHPLVRMYSVYLDEDTMGSTIAAEGYDLNKPLFDFDNFAILSQYQVKLLHRAAMISLLACRDMGDFTPFV